MHPAKSLRYAIFNLISTAAPTVTVDGAPAPVTVLLHPPDGAWINDDLQPGIYLYVRSETITPTSHTADDRRFLVDMVLQARGAASDAIDQVDDMQLLVERLVASDQTLGGIALRAVPVGADIYLNQGEVVFSSRRLTFEVTIFANHADPAA